MNSKITAHTFYKYMKCPAWVYQDALLGKKEHDLLFETLQTEGLIQEQERILLGDKDYQEVAMPDLDEGAQKTLEFMKNGVQTIYKGVLIEGDFVAQPDILERVEGKSKLGNWYYVACDIKRSKRLKDEYKMEGVFYADVLKRIQGVRPLKGYVIHGDGNASSYLIEEHFSEYHRALQAITDILRGNKPKHFLTSGYKQSPWFDEFVEEVRACDHLSLINRIWRHEVQELEAFGITTVEELADASLERLNKIKDIGLDRLYFLQQQAISLVEDRVIVMGELDFPEEELALVIDIESDPLRDMDYLFGVLVVDGEKETYVDFTAKTVEDLEQNWKNFVTFLEKYTKANIYHYGWYEIEVFRRLTEKYGAPAEVVKMFEEQMIDVLPRMREKVIFPSPFYSLKDVAKHLGFSWRHTEASGLNSILWYENWLKNGDKKALQDVIDYNEDDVRATWLVRNWAIKQGA